MSFRLFFRRFCWTSAFILLSVLMNTGALGRSGYSDFTVTQEMFYMLFQMEQSESGIHPVRILLSMTPAVLMVFYLSNYIVKGQNLEDAHLFVRYRSRTCWFLKKAAGMLFWAAFFSVLQVGCMWLLAVNASRSIASADNVRAGLLFGVVFFGYLLFHSLAANVVRILVAEDKVALCVFLHIFLEIFALHGYNFSSMRGWDYLNPAFYLVVLPYQEPRRMVESILFFTVLCVGMLWIGMRKCLRVEVGITGGKL